MRKLVKINVQLNSFVQDFNATIAPSLRNDVFGYSIKNNYIENKIGFTHSGVTSIS